MLGYDEDLDLAWDAAFVEDSPLGFVANNSVRPEHGGGTALTVQTTNLWADGWISPRRTLRPRSPMPLIISG